ncbi:MAG: glycosyltransferase [Nitrospira sp. SB0672_bin_25]|nr:glycosyltransferase [Nitrospira sp. SB0666_bin_27]MYF24386.1 glycosyltransferase [Nitrospira sp. SB0678_bin_10]MYJ54288.1 glycosyltransferase [Nitrospira sp. SB0672_bin_25]
MARSGNAGSSRRDRRKRSGGPSSGPAAGRPSVSAEGAIIIFAKAPVPGTVKTRMCPPLIPDEAASLHGSLVMDAVERTRSLRGFDVFLACTPGMDHPFFQTLAARHRIRLCDQVGEDLGQRMDHALTAAFTRGYAHAVIVGTDIPNLAARHYERATALLQTTDVVLGPTEDGGYYLVGAKHPVPALFADIPWSTGEVLTQSLAGAERAGLIVGLLDPERDLDTFDDIRAFLHNDAGSGRLSTRTGNVLHTLIQRHGEASPG